MELIPRNSLFDFESSFRDFFPTIFSPSRSDNENIFPKVDITESKDKYTIKADLPGVKKEDVNITLQNGILTLEARTQKEIEEQEGRIVRQERLEGRYMRSFTVDSDITENDIKAEFADGVLTLTMPRKESIEKVIKIN